MQEPSNLMLYPAMYQISHRTPQGLARLKLRTDQRSYVLEPGLYNPVTKRHEIKNLEKGKGEGSNIIAKTYSQVDFRLLF